MNHRDTEITEKTNRRKTTDQITRFLGRKSLSVLFVYLLCLLLLCVSVVNTKMHQRLFATYAWLLAAVAVLLVGCTESEPPPFRLEMTNVVALQISRNHQEAIANILDAMFGTPDKPFALPETGLDQRKLAMAAGPVWSDEQGGKHGLYRRHCAHCHGISGDGRGPTAGILNPYPRDYRRGVFKFKSTYTAAQPTDDDLRRVVHDGVPGTAMPAFALLPRDEIDALVEYVKYLSIRGQVETALENYVADELDPEDPLDPASDPELRELIVDEMLAGVMEGWQGAPEQVIVPEDGAIPPADRTPEQIAESAAKGRELFYGTRANCVKCHGPTGLGDGQQDDYDDWSKANKKFIDDTNDIVLQIEDIKKNRSQLKGEERDAADVELEQLDRELTERRRLIAHMLPPRNAIPRNLRDGSYRGGRRPLDLFWRVSAGIAGTPMPAGGPASEGAQGTLTQEEVWQIVDYIQSLPFEPASRPARRPLNVDEVN
jgi:mono/diheme cytochrome c family protein